MPNLAPLDKTGWLAMQPQPLREWAAKVGKWKTYSRGQPLYQLDQTPDAMFGLAYGCLELAVPLPNEDLATIYFAEPGFWVGESAILARAKRTMSLSAATETRVLSIGAQDILQLLDREPTFWHCFFALSHMNTTRSIYEYARAISFSTHSHVCWMLIRLSQSSSRIEISQSKMAELLGVTRSTIQRVLFDLADRGLISLSYRALTVNDRLKLHEAALEGKSPSLSSH